MYDNAFNTVVVRVPVGVRVKWINVGKNLHNAVAADGSWSTGKPGTADVAPGGEQDLTFDKPGVYRYYCGVSGYYERFPIKIPVGGVLVRVYLLNMVTDDPVASFHLHAETFDVYRTGTRLIPDERTDVVTLAQAERAIVEFRLPSRGRYLFHPHQRQMAERGAMGWSAAI